MKTWKVVVTDDVQGDLDNFVYYLLYRLCGDTVIVDRMFHDLQDIDRVMKE